jgi:hypothetical protein
MAVKMTPTEAEKMVGKMMTQMGFGESGETYGSGGPAGDGDVSSESLLTVSVKKTTTERVVIKAESEIRLARVSGRTWVFCAVFTDAPSSPEGVAIFYLMEMDALPDGEEGKQSYSITYPPPTEIEEEAGGMKITGGVFAVFKFTDIDKFEQIPNGEPWP